MAIAFAGELFYPDNFNNISVLLLDSERRTSALASLIAESGCEAITVHNTDSRAIDATLRYVYRFSEKIILIGFGEEANLALHAAQESDMVDAIIAFDPLIASQNFQAISAQDTILRIFVELEDTNRQALLQHYAAGLQEMQRDYKIHQYQSSDLEALLAGKVEDTNLVWHELSKIIQFI